jgi:hypothetical protein
MAATTAAETTTTMAATAAPASRRGKVGRKHRKGCCRQQGDHHFAQHV